MPPRSGPCTWCQIPGFQLPPPGQLPSDCPPAHQPKWLTRFTLDKIRISFATWLRIGTLYALNLEPCPFKAPRQRLTQTDTDRDRRRERQTQTETDAHAGSVRSGLMHFRGLVQFGSVRFGSGRRVELGSVRFGSIQATRSVRFDSGLLSPVSSVRFGSVVCQRRFNSVRFLSRSRFGQFQFSAVRFVRFGSGHGHHAK